MVSINNLVVNTISIQSNSTTPYTYFQVSDGSTHRIRLTQLSSTDFPLTSDDGYQIQKNQIVQVYGDKGCELTILNASALRDIQSLKSVDLPNLSFVGGFSFAFCQQLEKVDCPSASEIGVNAFQWCTKLNSFNLSKKVDTIDRLTFDSSGLTGIIVPSNVKTIKYQAFNQNKDLQFIELNEGLETIENQVFQSCSKLNSITIPSSVQSIGTSVFNQCQNIQRIEVLGHPIFLGALTSSNKKIELVLRTFTITQANEILTTLKLGSGSIVYCSDGNIQI